MKLYEVINGYCGFSALRVYVIANSEEDAIKMASKKYKEDSDGMYSEKYWKNLKAKCLCEDTAKEWSSEVIE